VAFFWDAVSLRGALFYFDVTEINLPYRDFFARELRAGRFSRWCPGLYCGLPLYSESQAGYLHPLKYLLYPWLETWQAFNLDTILSVWLAGVGTYGWLRRHVGPAGALTGAAVFGLGGFTWAHLIHTSMINAVASVPLVVWSLEAAWERGRWWPIVPGAYALACQVFAGHMQDTILTSELIALYAVYRAWTEQGRRARVEALGLAAVLIALAGALASVQGLPSKELFERSPRGAGLTWDELTHGSWHPELLPTLIVREAYGTRARDTDWMDGFYPYHEMNAYLGAIALALAVVGGAAYRERWVGFWVLAAGIGFVLMLGRFTFLFDYATRIPILSGSRIPVRYHLWVSLAVAALAAVGVDRLARRPGVRLRPAVATVAVLVLLCIPILVYVYLPVWTDTRRWTLPYHLARYRWLGQEVAIASLRTAVLLAAAWGTAVATLRASNAEARARRAAILPCLIILDLFGSHLRDVPTVSPTYWTVPPPTVAALKADPTFIRLFAVARRSAAEPGYASEPVDFFSVRDALDWSLPLVWRVPSARGETPIIPRRLLAYTDNAVVGGGRYDIESVSHLITGYPGRGKSGPAEQAGSAYIYRNPGVLPRARLMGRPYYVDGELAAARAVRELGPAARERLIVEDPTRPLGSGSPASGSAAIVRELPERVEVRTESPAPAYLVLADTFDPGWSATVDGRPAPIRPAFVAFRAVYLPAGRHTVVFRYRPVGFSLGLTITGCGIAAALVLLLWRRPAARLAPGHQADRLPARWPRWLALALVLIVAASAIQIDRSGHVALHRRWAGRTHRFTWGAGIEAMIQMRGNQEQERSYGQPAQ
jgi:hypothetical protein